MKRLMAALTALALCVGTLGAAPAAAASKSLEMKDLNLKMTIPQGLYAFTQDTSADNPDLMKAGITDWYNQKKDMQDQGTVLLLSATANAYTLRLSKKQDNTTLKNYNMTIMSTEAQQKLADDLSKPQSGLSSGSSVSTKTTLYTSAQKLPYIYMQLSGTVNGKQIDEAAYFTIINGCGFTFDTYRENKKLTATQVQSLKNWVDSLQVTKFLDKSTAENSDAELTHAVLFMLSPVLLIILLAAATGITGHVRRKREAARRAALLERITAYRKKQEDREAEAQEKGLPPAEPETLVENTTKCVKKALRRFSRVDLLLNRKGTWITMLVTAVLCILVAALEHTAVMLVIALAAAVFCTIYTLRIPQKVYQAEDSLYRKAGSRQVHYQFRKEDFRVSGVSSGVYPYVQIVRVCETDRYFYLYLGAHHVYLINKHSFTKGTADDLRALLKENVVS